MNPNVTGTPWPTSDPILGQTLACLRAHLHRKWGDREPIDVFNRLLAKNIRPTGWTPCTHANYQLSEIRSRREEWPTEKLGQLARGHSGLAGPRTRLDGPIIIVDFDLTLRVLDGNHRINTWVATGDSASHYVHIHTVEGALKFLELQPFR